MPNKAEIGGRILKTFLNYGKIIKGYGFHVLYIGRNSIKISYRGLDFAKMYSPKKCWSPAVLTPDQSRINRTNHELYIHFKGKLDYYKDFSMFYVFVDNDDGTQRLRSISERQFHKENHSYWTTIYGLPLTEEKIHSMLYDALNIAFNYQNNEEKFNKLIQKIEMYSIREV